jgi:hypothetical protein
MCAAHGMAITYLLKNKTLPGMPAQNPYPSTTDDRFVIEIRVSENANYTSEDIQNLVKETGIEGFEEKEC